MDFTIKQGSDWIAVWPITNPDGTPTDLTGWTVRAQVRDHHATPTLLHEWTSAIGNAVAATGQVELHVPAAVSAGWTWRLGRYDVEMVSPAGKVTRISEGRIVVDPEVTR